MGPLYHCLGPTDYIRLSTCPDVQLLCFLAETAQKNAKIESSIFILCVFCSMTNELENLLSPWDGVRVNAAAIGRLLGVSGPKAAARLRAPQREVLIRLIPFYGGRKKRLLYLRHSDRGPSFDAIITGVQRILPDSAFFWWSTGRVRRIDLLVVNGQENIGIYLSTNACPRPRD